MSAPNVFPTLGDSIVRGMEDVTIRALHGDRCDPSKSSTGTNNQRYLPYTGHDGTNTLCHRREIIVIWHNADHLRSYTSDC